MGRIQKKAKKKTTKKEGLLKGVKNIEDKNEKLLKAIEDKNEKQLKSIENQKKKKQLNAIEKINQLKLVSATFYQVFIF